MVFSADFKEMPWWWEAAHPEDRPTTPPARADVVIIGGGYTGLSAALTLRRLGHEVAVLDAERIGWGASSRNGGMVSGKVQVGQAALEHMVGAERASAISAACAQAFPFIEDLIAREGIDCDYVRSGRFTGACTPKQREALHATAALLQASSGLPARVVEKSEQRQFIGSDFYHGGMISESTGSLHPGKYARGLAKAASEAGAQLIDHIRVQEVRPAGSDFRVVTNRGDILAGAVLTATNGYSLGPGNASAMPWLARRLVPVASYVVATEELPAETMDRLFPKRRMIGETRRVLNYYRPSPDGKRIIWGGRASFFNVSPTAAAPHLHRAMVGVFPALQHVKLSHAWKGNVAFTFDHLPHIGTQNGVHYAAGCQGSGVALASWLGHHAALKIAGAANTAFPLADLPFPTRPLYNGDPWWVLPFIGNYYRMQDWWDQKTFGGQG